MKKRAKIITTIASLCLAVALMAFGVYAATSVSLTVTSKVSFTVTDVFVDVEAKAWVGTAAVSDFATESPNSSYAGYSYYTVGSDLVQFASDLHANNTAANAATATTWNTDAAEGDNPELQFTSTNIYITYMIKVTNQSTTNNVTVAISQGFIPALTNTARTVAKYKIGTGSDVNIKDTETTPADLAETAYSADVSAETSFTLAPSTAVTFTIVRKLVNASKSFAATAGNSLDGTLTVTNLGIAS